MSSALAKSLSRLSRPALTDLALHWIENPANCAPYLASNRTINESDEEDYLFPAAKTIAQLRSIWKNLKSEDENYSKQYIVDRIIDGDWRRGLSLYQHATIDFAHLANNDTALRWSALRLTPLESSISQAAANNAPPPTKKRKTITYTQPTYPTVSPHIFLQTLRSSLSPLLKATYHLTTLTIGNHALPILRLYLSPTTAFAPRSANIPRNARHATDGGRVMYIALPSSCPYVYVSLVGATASATVSASAPTRAKMDVTSIKRLVIEAIPKALSRPHERWALESTKLTARSLKVMCELRGNGRPGTAGGAFACLCPDENGKVSVDPSPVDVAAPKREYPSSLPEGEEERAEESDMFFPEKSKGEVDVEEWAKRKRTAELDARFGPLEHTKRAEESDMFFPEKSKGEVDVEEWAKRKRTAELDARFGPLEHTKRAKLDRVTARIEDVCRPRGEEKHVVDAASVGVTFVGSDVHAGLRTLAELGVLDVNCMPGWMAGSEARSMISV